MSDLTYEAIFEGELRWLEIQRKFAKRQAHGCLVFAVLTLIGGASVYLWFAEIRGLLYAILPVVLFIYHGGTWALREKEITNAAAIVRGSLESYRRYGNSVGYVRSATANVAG